MKIAEETPTAHSCDFSYGKQIHILADSGKNIYCARCNKQLLPTQVADKWQWIYKERDERR